MKYDTTPLSIDTAGVDLTPPENEVRFVPDDERPPAYGEISQPTIIAGSFGFDTFIEPPPATKKLDQIKDKLSAPKYRSWALTALLASASAIGGGFAVYWVSSDQPSPMTSQPRPVVVEPETEIKSADTFVSKPAADSAAAEPLVPHFAEVPVSRGRHGASTNSEIPATEQPSGNPPAAESVAQDQPSSSTPANISASNSQEPKREAKVGAYVVEKPAGRKPIARCADGTYSYSASRSAACSGRGGIGDWIGEDKPVPTKSAKQAAYVLGPRGGCYYLDSSTKKIYVEKKYCEQ